MKGDRDHAVPLSDAAFSILLDIKRDQEEIDGKINPVASYLPGHGQPFSQDGCSSLSISCGQTSRSPRMVFGRRSGTGAGDETEIAREVAEAALAHAVGDASERSYRRATALAKRRELMEAWWSK